MDWGAILLYGWLQVAVLPSGGMELYDNPVPEVFDLTGSFYVELGAEISWGCFFAGGSMKVPMWWEEGSASFWPYQLLSVVNAGVRWKGIELGWRHACAHAVIPFQGLFSWAGVQIVPRWDSAYDEIYFRIEAGRRL